MNLNKVLIGLGSNQEGPIEQVLKAIDILGSHPDLNLKEQSSLYRSSPQGPQDQDDFVNAVIYVETTLNPVQLLKTTQSIEIDFGRVKTRHWGERIIDLDILFFNEDKINLSDPDLSIPHPYALERDFVLLPAIEIAESWHLPDGSRLKDHQSSCLTHNLKRIPA